MPHNPHGNPANEIIALNAAIAELQSDNARLRAQLPAPEWLPLKLAASLCGVEYETVRAWCVAGKVEARRDGGRWSVNRESLKARVVALHRIAS
jgi:hypothetical protein